MFLSEKLMNGADKTFDVFATFMEASWEALDRFVKGKPCLANNVLDAGDRLICRVHKAIDSALKL